MASELQELLDLHGVGKEGLARESNKKRSRWLHLSRPNSTTSEAPKPVRAPLICHGLESRGWVTGPHHDDDNGDDGGVFWLIIPIRSTGRHEGMGNTVDAVFPSAVATKGLGEELAILCVEKVEKHGGVGRADERGYTLFKMGGA